MPANTWYKFANRRQFSVGTKYWLLHRTVNQKYNRLSLMTYLGAYGMYGDWNARPAAGTELMPWSWIKAFCEVPPHDKQAHFVNKDARAYSIPVPVDQPTEKPVKRPTVTADDVLSTQASLALALSSATRLRGYLVTASGRKFVVTVHKMPFDQVAAEVNVLGEAAYVIDTTDDHRREDDLAALAQDFPAIAYLAEDVVPWADRCTAENPCPQRAMEGGLSCGH